MLILIFMSLLLLYTSLNLVGSWEFNYNLKVNITDVTRYVTTTGVAEYATKTVVAEYATKDSCDRVCH